MHVVSLCLVLLTNTFTSMYTCVSSLLHNINNFSLSDQFDEEYEEERDEEDEELLCEDEDCHCADQRHEPLYRPTSSPGKFRVQIPPPPPPRPQKNLITIGTIDIVYKIDS
jgi:hypothetical protein